MPAAQYPPRCTARRSDANKLLRARNGRVDRIVHSMIMPRSTIAGVAVLSFLALAYGFLTIFTLTSLERNRREEAGDGPMLVLAGHGLMAASATGAALAIGFAVWTSFVH